MLQAFLLVSTACAEYSLIQVSCLSSLVNISLPGFNQTFNIYFSEQAAALGNIEYLELLILENSEFKNKQYDIASAIQVISLLRSKLDKADA